MINSRQGWYSWPSPYSKFFSDGTPVRVADEIKKLALFVGFHRYGDYKWSGTGFLVYVPFESNPNRVFGYFVTASHVADNLEGREFFVGMNQIAGGKAAFKMPPMQRWFRHPSKYTDVAVFPFAPDPSVFDVQAINIHQFLTEKAIQERMLGIGDEVVIAGTFSKHTGGEKFVPIIRLGTLAMFPDEVISNVKTGEGQSGEMSAYLIEARSIGGLSGSPVLVKETILIRLRDDEPGKLTIGPDISPPGRGMQGEGENAYFLGLAQGHWDISQKEKNEYDFQKGADSVNLGIALVVPAYVIREVIYQPELVEMRRLEEEAKARDEGTTTTDS
jgi:hypothetical protein